uniref:ribosomal protein S3 n=1 Tax=Xyris indica TaxID=2919641 RepID=UPI001F1489FA|nr:ribosomal protein S3 [Xyris indica]ULQ68361.1 ribosomal protein S3 [Xyris indica]ULQ68441.1 ribosomal protein S3 [Xyris indica]ULQ68678.1 ribosomal protein S3 [Xyris indica]
MNNMVRKINPLGFRLGTTQNHHSFWFEHPKYYPVGLQEDQKIRNYIKNYIQTNKKIGFEGIVRIEINKKIDVIEVIIYVGFSIKEDQKQDKNKKNQKQDKAKKDQKQEIEELQKNIQKEFPFVNRKINIAFAIIKKPYQQPIILAEYIALQIKNRVSFRKAMKKAIELAKETGTEGIKIQIAGRLGGQEIARVEYFREGRIPLQTIRAKIDYCSYTIQTVYGVLGIKIWIFVN